MVTRERQDQQVSLVHLVLLDSLVWLVSPDPKVNQDCRVQLDLKGLKEV